MKIKLPPHNLKLTDQSISCDKMPHKIGGMPRNVCNNPVTKPPIKPATKPANKPSHKPPPLTMTKAHTAHQ